MIGKLLFLCAPALVACAHPLAPAHTAPLPSAFAAPAATPPIALDVDDPTRTQHWFSEMLGEELAAHGVVILPASPSPSDAYVLHVRVLTRGSDHGVVFEHNGAARGSSRVDGAEAPASDSFRDAPSAEPPPYAPPDGSNVPRHRPTDAVDDFGVQVAVTLTRGASPAVLLRSSFDERALGINPVERSDRPREWKVIYRAAAAHIVDWLRTQSLSN